MLHGEKSGRQTFDAIKIAIAKTCLREGNAPYTEIVMTDMCQDVLINTVFGKERAEQLKQAYKEQKRS